MGAITKFWKDEEAVETMEFALIGGLFALAAIVGMTLLGGAIQTWFAGANTTMSAIPTS